MKKEEFKKAMAPIAEGLFGKQGARKYERPHFKIRPLGRMLRDLAEIEEEDWYRYAFSREPLNGKFSDAQRRDYMKKALDCGREYADKMCALYRTRDAGELAKSMGAQVEYPEYPEKTDRVMFAEFREPCSIRIYMDAVKKAHKVLEDAEVKEVLTNRLDTGRLLLAHELFHYVEKLYKKEIYTQAEKITLWSVGPLKNTSRVMIFGEIAAMGFAKAVTGIPYSPYLMDVFLVYGYSPEEASGLYEEMMDCAGRKPY